MKLLITMLSLMAAGCGTTGHMCVMHDFHSESVGGNPQACLRIDKKINDRHSIGYMHISHPAAGAPFNGKEEDVQDTIYYEYKVW